MLILKIAFRNIFRQKRRTVLTVITLGAGYLLFSLSLGITDGSYSNIIDLFTRDHTGHIQIHQKGYLRKNSLYRTLKGSEVNIQNIDPEIQSYSFRLWGAALAYGNQKTSPARVLGINLEQEFQTAHLKEKLKEGHWFTKDSNHAVVVGASLAHSLKLKPNDELILISQAGDGSIANDKFIVSGIVGTMDSVERMTVIMPLPLAQEFFVLPEQIHEVAILLKHYQDAIPVSMRIEKHLLSKDAHMLYEVSPWQAIEKDFYSAMTADKRGNFITIGIIMLMVAIGVLNTILMSVLERTREYGVIRALGTRPSYIRRLIVWEAFFLAVLGIGTAFLPALALNAWLSRSGIPLSHPIDVGGFQFLEMHSEVSAYVMLFPAGVTLLTAVVVSLLPAWRISKMNPLNALRSV